MPPPPLRPLPATTVGGGAARRYAGTEREGEREGERGEERGGGEASEREKEATARAHTRTHTYTHMNMNMNMNMTPLLPPDLSGVGGAAALHADLGWLLGASRLRARRRGR